MSIDARPGPAGDATGTSVEGTSVDSAGFVLTCKEYYKNNNNLLRILVTMCQGLKNEDDSDLLVEFNKDPPNGEMRSEEDPGSTSPPSSQQSCPRMIIICLASGRLQNVISGSNIPNY